MAQRRMFSLKIVDTDMFLDMPASSQLLYFHLSMRADDDGFISSPKKIMKIVSCTDDDMKILYAKRFVIPFESGICVIRHWKIHNYIQKDRYNPSIYTEEKARLLLEENGMYTECVQNGNIPDTQSRLELGKVRKGKVILDEKKPPKKQYGEYHHVLLTDKQYEGLKDKVDDRDKWIKIVDESIQEKGNIYHIKDFNLAIQKWYKREMKDKKPERKIQTFEPAKF